MPPQKAASYYPSTARLISAHSNLQQIINQLLRPLASNGYPKIALGCFPLSKIG